MRGAALAVAICATCAAQWRGRSVKNTRSSEDDPLAAKFSWIPSNDAFALNKIAQASQNKEGVEYLIDKEGYRPLHLAAQQGFVEVVPELLRLRDIARDERAAREHVSRDQSHGEEADRRAARGAPAPRDVMYYFVHPSVSRRRRG